MFGRAPGIVLQLYGVGKARVPLALKDAGVGSAKSGAVTVVQRPTTMTERVIFAREPIEVLRCRSTVSDRVCVRPYISNGG